MKLIYINVAVKISIISLTDYYLMFGTNVLSLVVEQCGVVGKDSRNLKVKFCAFSHVC